MIYPISEDEGDIALINPKRCLNTTDRFTLSCLDISKSGQALKQLVEENEISFAVFSNWLTRTCDETGISMAAWLRVSRIQIVTEFFLKWAQNVRRIRNGLATITV